MDKYSGLLRKSVNYDRKSFIGLAPVPFLPYIMCVREDGAIFSACLSILPLTLYGSTKAKSVLIKMGFDIVTANWK
jgi:hypothetical protein